MDKYYSVAINNKDERVINALDPTGFDDININDQAMITVRNVSDDNISTIFSDNSGTPLANPFQVDSNGAFEFYAANGRYRVIINEGEPTETEDPDAVLFDPDDATFLESGDNVSELVNDAGYVITGTNVSQFTNDANYLSSGDNVSELANDANYTPAGSNVSQFFNDTNYTSSGDNISVFNNDSGYITDAPADGTPYARQDNGWVPSSGGGSDLTTVIPQTGGGTLTALRENELRDGSTYLIPLANSVSADQIIIISLPDRYSSSTPLVTASGGDTITDSNGADPDGEISFDTGTSTSITLTSDGITNWSL